MRISDMQADVLDVIEGGEMQEYTAAEISFLSGVTSRQASRAATILWTKGLITRAYPGGKYGYMMLPERAFEKRGRT